MTGVAWTNRPPPVPPVPVTGGEGDAGDASPAPIVRTLEKRNPDYGNEEEDREA